jgi:predicted membrane chloride channel (bestrophin family)
MDIHSQNLFEQMFEIVGHSPEEQKTLSNQLIQAILQKTITVLVLQLTGVQQEEFKKLLAKGTQSSEVLSWLGKIFGIKEVEKNLTAISYEMTKNYLEKISSELSVDQQEKLTKLFMSPKI